MAFSRRRFPHILSLALAACVALGPVGCGGDGVNSYSVPKTTELTRPAPAPAAGDYRLLGLMVPADKPVWFFKYNGTLDVVAKYEADFEKLAASIEYSGDGPPTYTPPDGWQKGPGREMIYATVVTSDGKQEVGISQLPLKGDAVRSNLSRWVGMIGLKSGADDVNKYTKVIDGKGVKIRFVDLRGPKDPTTNRGGGGMAMPPGHP